jgi:regulator of replication initiation timing
MAGAAAIADLFGPPVVQRAVAVESLPLAALRVVVGATRDVELAVTRQRHEDLREHIEYSEARHDLQTVGLNTENRRLRRRLADSEVLLENSERGLRSETTHNEEARDFLNRKLALGADVLARWVARREGRMPVAVWDAILLMRRQDVDLP